MNYDLSVCFSYKNIDAKKLCTELYKHAQLMVGYGNFNGKEFVRLVTINSVLTEKDILNFFNTLEAFVSTKNWH